MNNKGFFSLFLIPALGFSDGFITFTFFVIDICVMVMPTVGYMDTIRLMYTSKSAAAFSYNTCFILLSAHGLKILYYIYHRYAFRIFGQSITQFTVAWVMAFLKYHYSGGITTSPAQRAAKKRRKSSSIIESTLNPVPSEEKNELSTYGKSIGEENEGLQYYIRMSKTKTFQEFLTSFFLYSFAVLSAFYLCFFTISETGTIGAVGLIANLIESTVSIPTFIKIVIHRDITNISTILILQFTFGDMMKLVLFILSGTPLSFIFGALLQLSIDTILFITFIQLKFWTESSAVDTEKLITKNEVFSDFENSMNNEEESDAESALKGIDVTQIGADLELRNENETREN